MTVEIKVIGLVIWVDTRDCFGNLTAAKSFAKAPEALAYAREMRELFGMTSTRKAEVAR
jgi:hypothetical protein